MFAVLGYAQAMIDLLTHNTSIAYKAPKSAVALLAICAALLGPPASAIEIDYVPVGNPGNANDTRYTFALGGVAYEYEIAKYEVTNAQYVEFLNAKDPTGSNPVGIFNIGMPHFGITYTAANPPGSKYAAKTGRENQPVTSLSWYDALRFANWLHNGAANGDTENGAYTLLGGTPTPSNAASITRNPGAIVFLPSGHEWYKAAYYNPATAAYFNYPTSSNTGPTGEPPPGGTNSANYDLFVGDFTPVGSYIFSPGPYGTFDQGGNAAEWNEMLVQQGVRGAFGGAISWPLAGLHASGTGGAGPATDHPVIGFRVARVPEPATLALLVCAALAALLCCSANCRRSLNRR
jgi:formylglycine-generating enzyme required for sulfatase activity